MATIDKIKVGTTTYDVGGGGGDTYAEVSLTAFTGAGSKDVTVTGCTADSHPILDVVTSTTEATAKTQIEAWSHIYAAQSGTNKITFHSDGATTAITVAVKGF